MNHTRSKFYNNLLSNRPLLLLWAQFFGRTQSELTICKGNNKYLVNVDGPPWLWKGAALLSNYGIPTFFLLLCWISFFGEIKKYTSCVLKKNLKVKTEKLKKKNHRPSEVFCKKLKSAIFRWKVFYHKIISSQRTHSHYY